MRRFAPGDYGLIGGVEWRVARGNKVAPGDQVDLRLDVRCHEWTPVKMDLGFLMADFLHENEDVLYPPSLGFIGGQMYLDYCIRAAREGWLLVSDVLSRQRSTSSRSVQPGS